MKNLFNKLFNTVFCLEKQLLRNGKFSKRNTLCISTDTATILLRYKIPTRLWFYYLPTGNLGRHLSLGIAYLGNDVHALKKEQKRKAKIPAKYYVLFNVGNWWSVQSITKKSADKIMTKKQLLRRMKWKFGKNIELKTNKWFWPYTTAYKHGKLVMVFRKEKE